MTEAQAAAIREGQEAWLRDHAEWLALHWHREDALPEVPARTPRTEWRGTDCDSYALCEVTR